MNKIKCENKMKKLDIWYDITQNIKAKETHDAGKVRVIKL